MPETLVEQGTQATPACSCGRTAKTPRLPNGWKRREETVWCDQCWRKQYLLRAVTMAVSSPVDCTWADLRKELKQLWGETTRCANWMITEMYVRDVRRQPGVEKMPPMPKLYLYPEARKLFPDLPAQTVAALEHAIAAKYRAARYEVIWTRGSSLPSHRYPVPFPVHNQSWHPMLVDDRPVVSVRLTGQRRELRLKTGPQFRRQMEAFKLMARGEAVTGELAIRLKPAVWPEKPVLLVKMVAWLPRPASIKGLSGELKVHTAGDAMLVAVNAKDERLWTYHGDHLPRWVATHGKRIQHWADDSKFENRPVPSFDMRRKADAQKFHHRMDSAAHEIAAQLAGYAIRRKFAAVEYDDTDRSFCGGFPWARLRSLIQEKLDAHGIQLKLASAAPEAESPEPLAEE